MSDPKRLKKYRHTNQYGVGVIWRSHTPAHATPIHSHAFYELELTLSGEADEFINGKYYKKRRGAVSVLSPADFHSFTPKGPLELVNLMFEERCLPGGIASEIFAKDAPPQIVLSENDTSSLENLFRVLCSVTNGEPFLTDIIVKHLIEAALLIVAKEYDSKKQAVAVEKPADILQVIQYIDLHFMDNPNIATVSALIDKSPDYFSKYFKNHTGFGYIEYLNLRKTDCARTLLEISDMPITEICFNSGFTSLSNFSRVFKSLTGKKPTEYRRAGKNSEK